MYEWLMGLPLGWLAFFGGCVCWLGTSLGAGLVFFCRALNQKYISVLLAFAGGIMLASSFFSLLVPALEMCGGQMWREVVFVVLGFLVGALFIALINFLFDKKFASRMGEKNQKKRTLLVCTSITLHNIPEGLAVGMALGGALISGESALFVSAVILAFGIAIQNIPEGASIALSVRCQNASMKKSFFLGVMSGVVEPLFSCLAGVIAGAVLGVTPIFLAFSAGAMMLVAVTELVPEATMQNKNVSVLVFSAGFALMTLLEIIL